MSRKVLNPTSIQYFTYTKKIPTILSLTRTNMIKSISHVSPRKYIGSFQVNKPNMVPSWSTHPLFGYKIAQQSPPDATGSVAALSFLPDVSCAASFADCWRASSVATILSSSSSSSGTSISNWAILLRYDGLWFVSKNLVVIVSLLRTIVQNYLCRDVKSRVRPLGFLCDSVRLLRRRPTSSRAFGRAVLDSGKC